MRNYDVGDRVQIIFEAPTKRPRNGWNPHMDEYLGQVMTIRELVGNHSYKMHEDLDDDHRLGGWSWSEDMFVGLAEEDFDTSQDTELCKFLEEYKK